MKKFKTALFVLGIILLAIGVYWQDVGLSSDVLYAYNMYSFPPGAISWDDFNYAHSVVVPGAVRVGLVFKLAGLGLLFSLFFVGLYNSPGNSRFGVAIPALLGLGSAACIGAFAVLAPVAGTVTWAWEFFSSNIPSGLDVEGLRQLGNGVYARAAESVIGALLLSVGLLLLAVSLVVRYRGM